MQNQKKQDIIIQLGGQFIRVGLVSDRVPRKTLPSKSFLKYNAANPTKYEVMLQQVLYNIFYSYLNTSCTGKTVIFLEKVFTDRRTLETMARILFTKLKIQKIEFALSCVTPLYLTGRFSGLVVMAGASCVQLMPIYQGYPLIRNYRCLDVGTLKLNKMIRDDILLINKEVSMDLLKSITEDEISQIRNTHAAIPASNQTVTLNIRKMRLKYIPQKINFGIFFGDTQQQQPNLASDFCAILNELPQTSLGAVAKNIVLAGGLWRIKGMQSHFKKQIVGQLPKYQRLTNMNVKSQLSFVSWSFNPSEVAWIGCSIGASIRSVDHLCLKRAQFQSLGFSQKIMKSYFLSG